MTTGWLIVNIAMIVVVAAIVAIPAVLIPLRLDRDRSPRATVVRSVGARQPSRGRDQRLADAA